MCLVTTVHDGLFVTHLKFLSETTIFRIFSELVNYHAFSYHQYPATPSSHKKSKPVQLQYPFCAGPKILFQEVNEAKKFRAHPSSAFSIHPSKHKTS
jgi:hypothetical protein